jgi:Glyoxalase-like domain
VAEIEGLWHATAMGPDYDALLGPLQRCFGAVVMHDHVSEDPAVGRRGGMIWIGDNSIEIGAPVGEHSPVRGFVEKLGGGMHSIALHVPDAAATRERLAAHGVEPVAEVSDDIFFTRPAATSGLLLEWSATHTDDDPRWGFPLTDRVVPPLAPATQYAFVSAAVADPPAVAEQLATLFGTDVVRVDPGAEPGQIAAVVSLVDCLLVLQATTGRTRFHGHGLVVDDLDTSLAALAEAGICAVGQLDDMVLLDPAALPVPTYLGARLLPEDPRLR